MREGVKDVISAHADVPDRAVDPGNEVLKAELRIVVLYDDVFVVGKNGFVSTESKVDQLSGLRYGVLEERLRKRLVQLDVVEPEYDVIARPQPVEYPIERRQSRALAGPIGIRIVHTRL
jgi:hypothetical protein